MLRLLPSVFSIEEIPSCSFPDPALALTSSLGHSFLPLVIDPSKSDTEDVTSLSTNGRFCLYYSSILKADPQIIPDLEQDTKSMIQLMYFLLLHSTFAKDKLALPTANSLWRNESGWGESEFMKFQAVCVELLERVCRDES